MDRALIERAAEACGVTLTASMIDRVIRYIDMLQAANQTTNLTAITDPEAIATKHLEDSWRLVRHVPPKASLIDVGTGAGFPGLALKIVRPDLDVTLIDATNKKVRFLRSVTEALGLECVRALHAGPRNFRGRPNTATDTTSRWPAPSPDCRSSPNCVCRWCVPAA